MLASKLVKISQRSGGTVRAPTLTLCRDCGCDRMLRVLMGSRACCMGREDVVMDAPAPQGFGNCWLHRSPAPQGPVAILTMFALIAVKPDLISVTLIEILQGPKWKILFPAAGIRLNQQVTEQRQRSKWGPFMLLPGRPAQACGCNCLSSKNHRRKTIQQFLLRFPTNCLTFIAHLIVIYM